MTNTNERSAALAAEQSTMVESDGNGGTITTEVAGLAAADDQGSAALGAVVVTMRDAEGNVTGVAAAIAGETEGE